LKDVFATHSLTSAAKAAEGDKGLIAALKRCATQNHVQASTFSADCEALRNPKPCFAHE
jgi:hypothetical protein